MSHLLPISLETPEVEGVSEEIVLRTIAEQHFNVIDGYHTPQIMVITTQTCFQSSSGLRFFLIYSVPLLPQNLPYKKSVLSTGSALKLFSFITL